MKSSHQYSQWDNPVTANRKLFKMQLILKWQTKFDSAIIINIKMNKLPKMYSSYGNRRRHIFHQQQITTVICHLGLETYHRIKRILNNSFNLGRCRHQHKRTKKNLVEKIKIMEIFCHQLLVTLFIYCVIKLYYDD